MFIIQYLDHEEGSAALWRSLDSLYPTKDDARVIVRKLRETDADDCLYSYRVVEKDSPESFSQPTDKGEY